MITEDLRCRLVTQADWDGFRDPVVALLGMLTLTFGIRLSREDASARSLRPSPDCASGRPRTDGGPRR